MELGSDDMWWMLSKPEEFTWTNADCVRTRYRKTAFLKACLEIRSSPYLGNDGMMGSGKTWHRIVGSRFMAIDKPA